jgi:hypothetical protein
MLWYWLVPVGVAGCAGLVAIIRITDKKHKEVVAAVNAHIGRQSDYFYFLNSNNLKPRRIFLAFVREHKFYIGEYAEKFDPKNFFGTDDIRAWAVEWETGVDQNDRVYKRRFALRVEVKSVDAPLIKIECQDETTAYKIREIFCQMFGEC